MDTQTLSSSRTLVVAAGLIIASEAFLVASGMIIKQLNGVLPLELIVFFRNLFGLVLLLPWLMRNGLNAVKTQRIHLHLFRGAVGVTAMSCLYYSWQYLPLAEAALLKQTAPFFMPLIAFWWLGERITSLVKWSILVGFIGVFMILKPTDGSLNTGVLIALAGAFLGGSVKVAVRRMSTTEPPERIVFYFALFSTLIIAIPAAQNWQTPALVELAWLFGMAITSTSAHLLLSRAYGMAPAGQLGPFTYTSVGLAALMGWLLWDEALALSSWAGITLIILAGLMALRAKASK
ncbi:MAG: DMT family transporter [Marinobacterium sp.]|nr:DMT family transporter [Marinobacterium sp.]